MDKNGIWQMGSAADPFVKQSPLQRYVQSAQYQSFPNQSYGNINYSTPIFFSIDPVNPVADPPSPPPEAEFDWGKYFNKDTLGLAMDGIKGVGSLLQGWSALKTAKLGKQQLDENRRMYDQNYAAQRTLTNNAIADQNAYKTAQGMSNLSNLVL